MFFDAGQFTAHDAASEELDLLLRINCRKRSEDKVNCKNTKNEKSNTPHESTPRAESVV